MISDRRGLYQLVAGWFPGLYWSVVYAKTCCEVEALTWFFLYSVFGSFSSPYDICADLDYGVCLFLFLFIYTSLSHCRTEYNIPIGFAFPTKQRRL